MELLARREHSVLELTRKLEARGFTPEDVAPVLAALQAERLQSDERFAETYVQQRRDRGYGPLRIRQELQERGINESLIDRHVDDGEHDWPQRLREAHRRKYGAAPPGDYPEQARRSRFLFHRGFSSESIGRMFRNLKEEYDAAP